MTPQLQAALAHQSFEPDWDDWDAILDYIVDGERPFAGPTGRARSAAAAGT